MNVRPMNDFIFVRLQVETMSAGGIVLPGGEKPWAMDDRQQNEGVVVSVGPGKRRPKKPWLRDSMWDLEPGQRIAFSPNGNAKQKVGAEELTVIRRDSVIGVVEEAHG